MAANSSSSQPWWELEPVPKRRTELPDTKAKTPNMQELYKIVKHGMTAPANSLSFPLPPAMLLPITELQRRAEACEYSELLDQAALLPKGSLERLLTVAAFAVSSVQAVGATKCTTPTMGETYELVLPEKKLRFLTETSYYCGATNRVVNSWIGEGQNWLLEGEAEPKVNNKGTSVDVFLNCLYQLTFADGDVYTWDLLTTGVTTINILSMTLSIKGSVVVRHAGGSGLSAHMHFVDGTMSPWRLSSKPVKHKMVGHLEQQGHRLERPSIRGHWDGELIADMPDGSARTIFSKNHPPPSRPNRYKLNLFSLRLNELPEQLKKMLPPSDTRWRWDLRAAEEGRFAEAATGKEVLDARWRKREAEHCARTGADSLPPRWFELRAPDSLQRPHGEGLRYRYKGGYWEARADGIWEGVEDDFAQEA